jgi:hypothetical protein
MVTAGIWLPIRPKFDLFACRCAAKTANEARLKVLNLCAGHLQHGRLDGRRRRYGRFSDIRELRLLRDHRGLTAASCGARAIVAA